MSDITRGRAIYEQRLEYPFPASTGVRDYIIYFVPEKDAYGKAARKFFSRFYPQHVKYPQDDPDGDAKAASSFEEMITFLHAQVQGGVHLIRGLLKGLRMNIEAGAPVIAALLAVLATTGTACMKEGPAPRQPMRLSSLPNGSEGAHCRRDQSCDPGYACLSDLCVNPDSSSAGVPPDALGPPTCEMAAAHILDLEKDSKAMKTETADQRRRAKAARKAREKGIVRECATSLWGPRMLKCVVESSDRNALSHCEPRPGDVPAPTDIPSIDYDAELSGEISVCKRYFAAAIQAATCTNIPKEVRESIVSEIENMLPDRIGLENPLAPPEYRQAIAEACRQGYDAMKLKLESSACGR